MQHIMFDEGKLRTDPKLKPHPGNHIPRLPLRKLAPMNGDAPLFHLRKIRLDKAVMQVVQKGK